MKAEMTEGNKFLTAAAIALALTIGGSIATPDKSISEMYVQLGGGAVVFFCAGRGAYKNLGGY
jgi:hypothetical protein